MTPVFCRVKHDPETGRYGDCVRACVASILDMEANPEAVPHFAHDNAAPEIVNQRLREYLATRGLAPWISHYDPDLSRESLLDVLAESGPGVHFMLYGRTESGGDHVVVCCDGKVVHDPAWYASPLVRGGLQGSWQVVVFAAI